MLKTYIKHTKCNFITPPISNKIMIKKCRKNNCLHITLRIILCLFL